MGEMEWGIGTDLPVIIDGVDWCQISSTQLYYIRKHWRPAWWAC